MLLAAVEMEARRHPESRGHHEGQERASAQGAPPGEISLLDRTPKLRDPRVWMGAVRESSELPAAMRAGATAKEMKVERRVTEPLDRAVWGGAADAGRPAARTVNRELR
jgi:hypothetical protein